MLLLQSATSFMSYFYSFDFLTFLFKIRSRVHLLKKTEYFLCDYTELIKVQ